MEKKNNSLKHTLLNSIPLFVLLFIGIFILVKIFSFLQSFLLWVATSLSHMDAVVVVALITGMVSIVSVVISSVVGKVIDYKKARQEYLAKKREKPYAAFIQMIYKLQTSSSEKSPYTQEEMISDIKDFSQDITLWGSSNVVNKWVEFREKAVDPASAVQNLFLMESIMNEMRKDMGLKKARKGRLNSDKVLFSIARGRERCDRNGHAVFLRPGVDFATTSSETTGISTSSTKLKWIFTFCTRLPLDLSGANTSIFLIYSLTIVGVNSGTSTYFWVRATKASTSALIVSCVSSHSSVTSISSFNRSCSAS